MFQLNIPATLLRALKGPAISIVVACLIEPERRLAAPELQALTGYSPNTIRAGLNTLSELGLIHRVRGRYQLTDKMQQLMLPLPATQTDIGSDQVQNLSPAPLPAQELRHGRQKLRDSEYCSCPEPDSLPSTLTPDQLAQPAQEMSATGQSLVAVGVYPHVARELAADPWITAERVDAWLRDLREQNRKRPGTIRSVPAVLAANLKAHLEPPSHPSPPDNDRRRFTSGPYADWILS
jgi:hypothetical protein